jgi:hypothetical protein
VDAPPHKISIIQTVAMAKDFEFAPAVYVECLSSRRSEGAEIYEKRNPEIEDGVCRVT